MTATIQALRTQHKDMLAQAEQLREVADLLDMTPVEALMSELDEIYNFIEHTVLTHAEAEEEILFPAVAHAMGAPESTSVMVQDHRAIARHAEELIGFRQILFIDPPTDAQKTTLRRLLYSLHALLKLHLAKEEDVYFPILEASMGAGQLEALTRSMEAVAYRTRTAHS